MNRIVEKKKANEVSAMEMAEDAAHKFDELKKTLAVLLQTVPVYRCTSCGKISASSWAGMNCKGPGHQFRSNEHVFSPATADEAIAHRFVEYDINSGTRQMNVFEIIAHQLENRIPR
eukprot:ANDGO_04265.mRNA.1 hypothetical protein